MVKSGVTCSLTQTLTFKCKTKPCWHRVHSGKLCRAESNGHLSLLPCVKSGTANDVHRKESQCFWCYVHRHMRDATGAPEVDRGEVRRVIRTAKEGSHNVRAMPIAVQIIGSSAVQPDLAVLLAREGCNTRVGVLRHCIFPTHCRVLEEAVAPVCPPHQRQPRCGRADWDHIYPVGKCWHRSAVAQALLDLGQLHAAEPGQTN